jgi:hypothetical protein
MENQRQLGGPPYIAHPVTSNDRFPGRPRGYSNDTARNGRGTYYPASSPTDCTFLDGSLMFPANGRSGLGMLDDFGCFINHDIFVFLIRCMLTIK